MRLADGRAADTEDPRWWVASDGVRCQHVHVLSDALGIALRCELSAGHAGYCQADEGTRMVLF
jgi:hypothetical protein